MKNILLSTALTTAMASGAVAEQTRTQITQMSKNELRDDLMVSSQGQSSSSAMVPLIVLTLLVLIAASTSGGSHEATEYAMYSDQTLKTGIKRVGTAPSGIGIYRFSYRGDAHVFEGTLAQDVLRYRPAAVSRGEGGYLMVDYGQIDVTPRLIR